MFSKTNVTLETCTQELAKTFATMPGLEGERPLNPKRLEFLDAHRKAGTFVSPTWAIVIDKTTGQKYRTNGQHSSRMLADCPPEEYPTGLLVSIEEYTSDDLAHDAFILFQLWDHPRSARSNADVMNQHVRHYADLAGIEAKLCLTLCSGIARFEASRGEKGEVLSARERGAYLQHDHYRSFVVWAATLSGTVHASLLNKPGVVAEMVANRGSDPTEADEFWRLVFTESHPDSDHETRELSRTLREWARKKPKVGQDRFRREAAKQWRRFRRAVTMPQIPYEAPSPQQDSASA
jgi:hypothetical protein